MNARPSRVLYVVSLFPCWSETFIVREIEQLLAAGVDVRILSLKPPSESFVQARAAALMPRVLAPRGGLAGAAAALGELARQPFAFAAQLGPIVAGLLAQPAVLAKTLVACWRALSRLAAVREFDPELVHAHWATYPSTVAWAMGRACGKPFSFTAHAHDIFVEDQLLARKLADARLVVTISEYNVRHLERWRQPGSRAPEVVHCGVDLQELPLVLDGREPALLATVGRLDPIKGFDVLLQALALLQGRAAGTRCELIGDGPLRESLHRQRERLGLKDVLSMPGAKPQEHVRALLARAAVFVMPSVRTPGGNQDGIPVALMEAMASGAAVVATTVSGIPELVVDGENGLLVPPDDPRALADAIARLLGDAALRRRLGAAARETVARAFDARLEAQKLLAHMSAAVRGPAA